MDGKNVLRLTVFAADFISLMLGYIFFFYFRVTTGWFDLILQPDFLLPMLIVNGYWLFIFNFVGMYKHVFAPSRFDELSELFKVTFVGIFILFFLIFFDDYSHGVESTSRVIIFYYWGFLLAFVGAGRLFVRSMQRNLLIRGVGTKKGIIVGSTQKAVDVFKDINAHPALGVRIAGFIDIENQGPGDSLEGVPVLGGIHDIERIIKENRIEEVVIALEQHHDSVIVDIIGRCETHDVGMKMVPEMYEILSGQARTSQLYGIPLIDINPEPMKDWEKNTKRLMDIVFSMIMLILSLPVIILTAIAIKLDSRGPVFFTQERVGLKGRLFKIVKFRSMYTDAEAKTGPVWSTKDDPRVTRVGRFIRKVRIDEIPQVFNVLKGEMSLIGPRPERPYFVELLSQEIPYYKRRLRVRPGITGWAQVRHKYDETLDDVKGKIRYDLFYIENMSLRMDFKILLRTVFVVSFGKGHFE
ncbi:MAG: undecaprenyl-phosphate glucose phosphotransferase [Ignavibacteriaceae bacterium]|nr:undecaprenyl-phosphate glucose phosphotransferase [Ignavibacteriaceae bacterium]